MDELLKLLLKMALHQNATDIHFSLHEQKLEIELRTEQGLMPLRQDLFDGAFLSYLQFQAGMDLSNLKKPQSGQFEVTLNNRIVDCRFSLLQSKDMVSGALRILARSRLIALDQLTTNPISMQILSSLSDLPSGLIICAGPTGSGKTTTLHAVLRDLACKQSRKIVSLEDPVEIAHEPWLQLEAGSRSVLSYETGIEELMRHDPDVILIGECRSEQTAAALIRASLTGHLVLSTIHAGNGEQAVRRLLDLGVAKEDLQIVLKRILCQKLVGQEKERECLYEIWTEQQLKQIFDHKPDPEALQSMEQAERIYEETKKSRAQTR